MNLYKISQTENTGYDTYDSAIVAAPDEKSARETNPNGRIFAAADLGNAWVSSPDQVEVELIGTAAPGIQAGVILASFNGD